MIPRLDSASANFGVIPSGLAEFCVSIETVSMLELCLPNLKYFTDVCEDKEQDRLETLSSFLKGSQQQWKLEPGEIMQHIPGTPGHSQPSPFSRQIAGGPVVSVLEHMCFTVTAEFTVRSPHGPTQCNIQLSCSSAGKVKTPTLPEQ